MRRRVDLETIEGGVLRVERALERHHLGLHPPWDLAKAIDLRLEPGDACIGSQACILTNERLVRLRRAFDALHWLLVQHELAHLFAKILGWPQPHDEEAIDTLAARLWIRRRPALRAVGLAGWSAADLVALLPETPAAVTFRRIAEETGALVLGRDGLGRRFAHGAPWHRIPRWPLAWETRHIRAALAGAREPFLHGGEVASFIDPLNGQKGAVILYPPEREFVRV